MTEPDYDNTDEPLGRGHPGLGDGRQSAAALAVRRGAMRLLAAHNFMSVPEVTLASGRRADLVALSDKGDVWIVEIKSCLDDYRADSKWHEYAEYCDRFYFAVDQDFPSEIIPETAGLIIADRFGAEFIRTCDAGRLPAARRKALTLLVARVGAARLQSLSDPDADIEAVRRF